MSLVDKFTEFFEAYDSFEDDIEVYCAKFLRILAQMAVELNPSERDEVNKICATLATHSRRLKKLRKEIRTQPTDAARGEIRELDKFAGIIINDFRTGDILKRYREKNHRAVASVRLKIEKSEELAAADLAVESSTLPDAPGWKTPSRQRSPGMEALELARSIVEQTIPDAPQVEKLRKMQELLRETARTPAAPASTTNPMSERTGMTN